MFIVNPDPFLLPSYRMSPFSTSFITENNSLKDDDFAKDYFDSRFGKENWKFTNTGRQAIKEALKNYALSKEDVVSIITTSQNFYISSCVTATIEEFCKWNREIVPETKVILVNHEFGFPYQDMNALQKLGLPIIEDCCTTFFSQDTNNNVGTYGDYSVYSFPKFFPIQIGGLLVANHGVSHQLVDPDTERYLLNVLSHNLKNEEVLLKKRKENYDYALSKFSKLGFEARFESDASIVPYALVLKNNSVITDLNRLKEFLNTNGIQNSVFYGEDAFFIANHQNLSVSDIDLMYQCLEYYLLKKAAI